MASCPTYREPIVPHHCAICQSVDFCACSVWECRRSCERVQELTAETERAKVTRRRTRFIHALVRDPYTCRTTAQISTFSRTQAGSSCRRFLLSATLACDVLGEL